MDVGTVKVAEDKDFENLKELVDNHTGWKLDYSKSGTNVWTKSAASTNFKMVKVKAAFPEITPELLYDVLHDPEYRKIWDQHMIEAKDIGCLNPNNDATSLKKSTIFMSTYFSEHLKIESDSWSCLNAGGGHFEHLMSCPTPLANRDFVLQRSWLDLGKEKYILNHSVHHRNHPPRQGFVRATSHLTGYLVRTLPGTTGCELGYISQTDPHGTLPPWLVNRVTQIFGPKMIKNLQKATLGYSEWKASHNPHWKPWHYPEQILSPRITMQECMIPTTEPTTGKHKTGDANKLEVPVSPNKKKNKKDKTKSK